jgi:GntR family transcriptional regulator
MTTTTLAADSAVPLYRQLMKRIADEVEGGTRAPGSKLPSEREWAESLGVSRITIRQALSALVQRGYLYSVPGKGFFVSNRRDLHELNALLSFTAASRRRGEVPSSKVLEARLTPASAGVADQLGITPGSEVVLIKRLRRANDVPVMLQESWLPHAICPGILKLKLEDASLYDVLRDRYDIALKRAQTTITARAATREQVQKLRLKEPVVLIAEQLTFNDSERPIERSVSSLHPERHPLFLVQDEGGGTLTRL